MNIKVKIKEAAVVGYEFHKEQKYSITLFYDNGCIEYYTADKNDFKSSDEIWDYIWSPNDLSKLKKVVNENENNNKKLNNRQAR